jgi:class 3 adenylate cyclase
MTETEPNSVRPFRVLTSIRVKMAAVGLAVTVVTGCLGYFAYRTDQATAERSSYIYDTLFQSISYARQAQTNVTRLSSIAEFIEETATQNAESRQRLSRLAGALRRRDDRALPSVDEMLEEARLNLNVSLEAGLQEPLRSTAEDLIARIQDLESRLTLPALAASANGEGGLHDELLSIKDDIDYFVQDLAAEGAEAQIALEDQADRGARHIVIAVIFAMAIAAIAALTLGELVARQVCRIRSVADAVAEGELDKTVPVRGRTELTALMERLEHMRLAIKEKIQAIEDMRARADRLVDNVLPKKIADRLRQGEARVADGRAEAVVVFIDIVGFTKLTRRLGASHLIETLDDIFSRLDEAAIHYGIEKIKTIGDAYMAAAGVVEEPAVRDACDAAQFALAAQTIIEEAGQTLGYPLKARIGLHNGPLVAGVLGKAKLVFDVWGDAVNVASRLESSGNPGEIRVSESAYYRLHHEFELTLVGDVDLKGMGSQPVYLLKGRKGETATATSDNVVPMIRGGEESS